MVFVTISGEEPLSDGFDNSKTPPSVKLKAGLYAFYF